MQITTQLPVSSALPNIAADVAKSGGHEQGFADTLKSAVQQIDASQQEANARVTELLAGGNQDVHGAMIAVERASLSFELMMQVRNKMVSAYQEISRLQF